MAGARQSVDFLDQPIIVEDTRRLIPRDYHQMPRNRPRQIQ